MSARKTEVRCGALTVEISLDMAGCLVAVSLPRKVPVGMDAVALAGVLAQLAKYEIAEQGTPFLMKAWQAMRRIPWGSALTYQELARAAGSPAAVRAAGQACARNSLPLIVPCHRVLAKDGLGGFAYGLEWKARLLEIESEPQPSI